MFDTLRQELDFLLFGWLKSEDLLARPSLAEHSRDTLDPILDLAVTLAEREFLPSYKMADTREPQLVDGQVRVLPETARAVRTFSEAGLAAASLPTSVGGLAMPQLFATAAMAPFMAANVAASGYQMLAMANARVIARFGSERQADLFARPQLDGRALGTMCLSEPQAGSSLGDITTRARLEAVDSCGERFRLTGSKMWISAGDHDITADITHLVLAKIEGEDSSLPRGSKGISLFIVPKRLPAEIDGEGSRNDVAVAGLNHKMGYRGTANCVLSFGEGLHQPFGAAGAVGYLLGRPGAGLTTMFQMMNEARINVGLGAAALAYRGYRLSVDYARERTQGRPLGDGGRQDPVALIEHPDVRRMLLAQKCYAEGALALCLYSARLVDEEAAGPTAPTGREAGELLGLLTPVTKTWPSEWGLKANDLAIQIHGGYGYTRDFDVEQLYRDNRLNPIHEGTTGIQAIDLLRRKVLRDRGHAFGLLKSRIERTACAADEVADLTAEAAHLRSATALLDAVIGILLNADDEPLALANATPFLFAFGHVVLGWIWLDQAIAAKAGDHRLAAGKAEACRFFFAFEVPKVAAWLAPVRELSRLTTDVPTAIF